MKEYAWRPYGGYKADVNEVVSELKELGYETKGVSAEEVLNHARSEESVIHSMLEWDDAVGGEKYRLVQVRGILGSIVCVQKEEVEEPQERPVPVRALVKASVDRDGKGRYWEVERAMSDPGMAHHVLMDASRDAAAMAKRYRALSHYSAKLVVFADQLEVLAKHIRPEPLEEAVINEETPHPIEVTV